MLINLSDVLSEQHKPIIQDVVPELEKVKLASGIFSIISKVPMHIEITHISGKELMIEGCACISTEIPCDRCLIPVSEELDLRFAKRVNLEMEDETELDEANYIDGYYLDVDQLLYNEILIGWPMKILCCEDCRGICSSCGQNLNKGTCECEDTSLDPRMSVVRDVFKNFKEV